MSKKLQALLFISVLAIICVIALVLFTGPGEKPSNIKRIGINKGYGGKKTGGLYSKVYFEYNDKDYWAELNGSDWVVGDKFIVYVDTIDPLQSYVDPASPLFESGENIMKASGKVLSTTGGIEFEYKVQNIVYSRYQFPPDNYEKIYGPIKEGDHFLVEYLLSNPKRAVIYLDQKVR